MKRALLALTLAAICVLLIVAALPVLAWTDAPTAFTPNPRIAALMAQVQASTVYSYEAQISGEVPVIIGGAPYTLTSRHTDSGVPIQKATQYVYEQLQLSGVSASYHNWTNCSRSNRNVVGVMTGTVHPAEIVLITAHLDDMPSSGRAPGADDNGSGSVAVLLAAKLMSAHQFERTIRFVWFTGEEQQLCGSEAYSDLVFANGDNIVAVYNMDMIAYDSVGGPTLRLHTRTTSNPGYAADLAIAGVFTNVVQSYGLSSALTPIIDPDGENRSDHSSFWNVGYPAVLAIEDDDDDFNDYYHTINDNLSHINLTYMTNYVKASIGTVAHLARLVDTTGVLRGSVIAAQTSQPIAQARVQAVSNITSAQTTTNPAGDYAFALPAGSYTLTASAYGYQTLSIPNVEVQAALTTTHSFAMQATAFYTVSGHITDALAGWSLGAVIAIAGYPDSPINSDPATGAYQVVLAADRAYTFTVQANSSGYISQTRSVGPLTANRVEDFALAIDQQACSAPGYTRFGVTESFDQSGLPAGWEVLNTSGSAGWSFANPGSRTNQTGGTGNFAIADSDYYGNPNETLDTELRTPLMDLTTLSAVTLTFKTDFYYFSGSLPEVADVDVSIDSGATWNNVWRKTTNYRGPHTEVIDLTSLAAHQPDVIVRFHYAPAKDEWWWQIDDVQLGACVPLRYAAVTPKVDQRVAQRGEVVTYTLWLSNIDGFAHSYDVLLSDHFWPMMVTLPDHVAARAVIPITITVAIPAVVPNDATEVVTATVRAQDDHALNDQAMLTTSVLSQHFVYLPSIER